MPSRGEREAGGADGGPSAKQIDAYVAALKPCITAEVTKLGALMAPVTAAVPRARDAVAAATPSGAPHGDIGAPAAPPKKGLLW